MRLEGKVALISGGARGLGAAEAKLIAREGAKVVIGDILESEGKQVEAEINESGGECLFVQLDVTSQAHWERAVEAAVFRFGTLNILVNNAGITGVGVGAPMEEASEESWQQVMDVNAKGVFLGTKHAIPEMRKAGGGSIINISSIAGLVALAGPSFPRAGSGAYAASKGAVRLLTKATAVQYALEGIRCNSVHPGFIDTPMTERSMSAPGNQEDRIRRTPLGRMGTPEEIAYGVLFLASDESSFVTGSELVIDGGVTAQ